MAVASKKDFSLKENFTYTYVKYPDSFHATLVQVANDMHRALFGAHRGMEKIQANMRQMPTLLSTALKLITLASTSMVKAMLPRTLVNIARYANNSVAVAQDTYDQFQYLQRLLEEIVEVSTLTNKENRDMAEKLANETKQLELDKETMNIVMANLSAEREDARKKIEEARADYHAAMIKVPSDQWEHHAFHFYLFCRPAVICTGWWFWRRCRYVSDPHIVGHSHEAIKLAQEALVCFLSLNFCLTFPYHF